jgi:FdhE protein
VTPLDGWLTGHPYLRPMASWSACVESAAARVPAESAPVPAREGYRDEFLAGVPLLGSEGVAVDFEPAGVMALALVRAVASEAPAGRLRDEAAALDAALRSLPDAARKVADFLLGDESWSPPSPGLLRYLGWAAAARWLRPVVEAFERSGEDERWGRRYCPTCGSAPAMAHLSESESSRARRLCCGMCGTRWQYPRTKCPFCEADSQKLSIVAVAGEGGLRIDYCPSCRGYLKTYAGEGDERILLADWTSLHLDLLARDRNLVRAAASLYEIEPTSTPS